MTEALTLSGVTKRYGGFTAVDSLSFHVPAGKLVGFLGPNGAGKTTTIRMIMSINFPDAGEIRVLGRERAIDAKDRIGYLPEERGLYRKMTVEQTLHYFGRLKGMGNQEIAKAIEEGLRRVGLSDWRRKKVESLSKGMQQKVQFVATIMHGPELIILDEPFSGLDPLNRDLLESLMLEQRDAGHTVLFSTHQLEQAERLCDRIVLLNRGRKLLDGSIADVRSQFALPIAVFEGDGDFDGFVAAVGETASARIGGRGVEFPLRDAGQANDLLAQAVGRIRLTRFEVRSPSLQEIFVNLIRSDEPDSTAAPQPSTAMNGARA